MHLADGKLDLKNTFQSLEPTGAGCIAWHHDIFQNWGTAAPEQIRLCVPLFLFLGEKDVKRPVLIFLCLCYGYICESFHVFLLHWIEGAVIFNE